MACLVGFMLSITRCFYEQQNILDTTNSIRPYYFAIMAEEAEKLFNCLTLGKTSTDKALKGVIYLDGGKDQRIVNFAQSRDSAKAN